MAQLNDLMHAALTAEGYSGALPDMLHAWLLVETGQTSGATMDLWQTVFDADGVGPGAAPDRLFSWLGIRGAVGDSLSDRSLDYWTRRLG